MNHQEPAVSIDRDMALAPDDLLAGVVTPCFALRSLDRLAVEHPRRGAGLAPGPLTVHHQRQVMDGLEQEASGKFPKPAVDRLPGSKVIGSIRQPHPERTR